MVPPFCSMKALRYFLLDVNYTNKNAGQVSIEIKFVVVLSSFFYYVDSSGYLISKGSLKTTKKPLSNFCNDGSLNINHFVFMGEEFLID